MKNPYKACVTRYSIETILKYEYLKHEQQNITITFWTIETSGVPEMWQTSDKKTDRQLGSLGKTRLWLCADFWLPESSWPLGQAYTYSFVSWCQLNMHKLTLFLCVLWLPLFFFRPGGNLSYNCEYTCTCIYNKISNSPDFVSNILRALKPKIHIFQTNLFALIDGTTFWATFSYVITFKRTVFKHIDLQWNRIMCIRQHVKLTSYGKNAEQWTGKWNQDRPMKSAFSHMAADKRFVTAIMMSKK